MTWPDVTSRWGLWRANVRLGSLEFRHEWPPVVLLLGSLVPTQLRLVVFVLIGGISAGEAGMEYAYIGCVLLAITAPCISNVSDIPVHDAAQRRYAAVRAGCLAPLWQYVGRAAPLMVLGFVQAVCAWALLGAVVGDPGLMVRIAGWLPVVAVCIPLLVMFGFLAVAPPISNDAQNLWHNLAVAVVTVCSGAIFSTELNPVLHALAQVIPLHHATAALRAFVEGEAWLRHLGLEVAVGAGWSIVAVVVYQLLDRRGRSAGTGAFGT